MINQLCVFCKRNIATEKHHLFPKHKWAKDIYGKLLDSPWNLAPACNDCNGSHRNVVVKNERWFRYQAEQHGVVLPLPSKTFKK